METVKVFRSYKDAADVLEKTYSKEVAYDFLMAVLEYGLDGTLPEMNGVIAAMFTLCKPNIDASIELSVNGSKGGRGNKKAKTENAEVALESQKAKTENAEVALESQKAKTENAEVALEKSEAEEGRRKKEEGSKKEEVGSRKEEVEKGNTPQAPRGATFEDFWQEYPRKVGKIDAKKKWDKLRPGSELSRKIMNALREQKKWSRWTDNNGEFIPNPATWLNQGRWEDELPDKLARAPDSAMQNWVNGGKELF